MTRILLALLLLVSAAWANSADLEAEIQRAKAQMAAEARQAEALKKALAALDAKTKALVQELRTLETRLAQLERSRRSLALEVHRLEAKTSALKKEETAAKARLRSYAERLRALMLRLWYQQVAHRLPLLHAQSFTELAVKTRWLERLAQADLDLVQAADAEAKRLAEVKRRLEATLQKLRARRRELERKTQAVAAQRRKVRALLAQLERQKKAKTVRLAQLSQSQEELNRRLAELKRQLEAARAEEARRRAELPVPQAIVGRLLFPIPGGRIIHAFGANGQYFEWIQAPRAAAPVLAAADGQVFAVLYYGNIGWTVMIQHDKALFTQYVNLQAPPIRTGDRVEQGEVIGYLGGGTLIPPDVLWFRAALWKKGRFYYLDPARFY